MYGEDANPTPGTRPIRTLPQANLLVTILQPLASLKLTVALLAAASILVFVGTLAQWRMDPFEAVNRYFRTWVALIEPADLLPKSFFPTLSAETEAWETANVQHDQGSMSAWMADAKSVERIPPAKKPFSIPFPGGKPIGLLMMLNLLAAHGIKFKFQARGSRLLSGLLLTAVGVGMTWYVVTSRDGTITSGMSDDAQNRLWYGIVVGLASLWAWSAYGLMTIPPERKQLRIYTSLGGLLSLGAFLYVGIHIWRDEPLLEPNNTRILWQLIQAQLAGIVLLGGCYLLFRKRAGVVLLHAGILLLMSNELVVSWLHHEWKMNITEKETAWYAHDLDHFELTVSKVIPDPKDPERESLEVVTIPWDFENLTASFERDGVIRDPRLPFDLRILRYYANAQTRGLRPGEKPLATHGIGAEITADEKRRTGANDSDRAEAPVVWFEVLKKGTGESLGKYMLSALLGASDNVDYIKLDESPDAPLYALSYRYRRDYKPYTVTLQEVRKDDYLGSNIPRNYSSDVLVEDSRDDYKDKHHIRMNEPLRYKGETFYQSGYVDEPRGTTLQIVSNTGWMIPYVSCMIVLTGMVFQFLQTLGRFFNRMESQGELDRVLLWMGLWNVFLTRKTIQKISEVATDRKKASQERKSKDRFEVVESRFEHEPPAAPSYWPLVATATCLLLLIASIAYFAMPKSSPPDGPNLQEFGAIPAVFKGRVKPLDTLARNSLRILSRGETFTIVEGDKKRTEPAIRWLLDLWGDFEVFENYELFYLDHPDLLTKIGLKRTKNHLYSWKQLTERSTIEPLMAIWKSARGKPAQQLDALEKKAAELEVRMNICIELIESNRGVDFQELIAERANPDDREGFLLDLSRAFVQAGQLTVQTPLLIPYDVEKEWGVELATQTKKIIKGGIDLAEQRSGSPMKLPFPTQLFEGKVLPIGAAKFMDDYAGFMTQNKEKSNRDLRAFETLLKSYKDGRYTDFNEQASKYRASAMTAFAALPNYSPDKVETEKWFNGFSPFHIAMPFYILAAVMGLGALMFGRSILLPAAFWLLCGLFVLHTVGLVVRIYLSGRPPVTNLYSSALFIGWGCVALSLAIEVYTRKAFGVIVAGFAGFFSLLISLQLFGDTAHWSGTGGDTMGVMQAVLDTQFWLATHVVTVALGYSTTALAGLLGAVYLVFGALTPKLTKSTERDLLRAIYGVLCFAIVLSFVGTVLGGLWADDSWGRFWGWDPKENGALIIVLWNALVLHAVWDKQVKDRGLAALAVFGSVVTSWSWFGVNELGVGLHSYGFTDGTLFWLGINAVGSLAIMSLALIPREKWLSYDPTPSPAVRPRNELPTAESV